MTTASYSGNLRSRPRFIPTRSHGNEHNPVSPQLPQRVPWASYAPGGRKPKLLDQVREAIRTRHYSLRTEEAYVRWIKRFIFFHDKRHPLEMGERRARVTKIASPCSLLL